MLFYYWLKTGNLKLYKEADGQLPSKEFRYDTSEEAPLMPKRFMSTQCLPHRRIKLLIV